MHVAYLSLDEVNRHVAEHVGANGRTIHAFPLVELRLDDLPDAVVCDLDHIPTDMRQRVIDQLIAVRPVVAAAAHSCSFQPHEVSELDSSGIEVHDRLTASVFARLQQPFAMRGSDEARHDTFSSTICSPCLARHFAFGWRSLCDFCSVQVIVGSLASDSNALVTRSVTSVICPDSMAHDTAEDDRCVFSQVRIDSVTCPDRGTPVTCV
jgi:hypothetical protein